MTLHVICLFIYPHAHCPSHCEYSSPFFIAIRFRPSLGFLLAGTAPFALLLLYVWQICGPVQVQTSLNPNLKYGPRPAKL